jgi:uncharacterized protein YndB with AHSA1/START domain
VRESIDIAADAQAVWPLVADPAQHARWNEKVVSICRERKGPVTRGERFEMTYRVKGGESTTRVEVLECRPPHSVLFRHRTEWRGGEQISDEKYEIERIAHSVRLTQTIDFSQALPGWAVVLLRIISRLGSKVGKSNLQGLRDLAEPAASSRA